jgi:uncharacterized membrane protein
MSDLPTKSAEQPEPTPAWQRRTLGEYRWPAAVVTLALPAAALVTPEMALGPRWLVPALEVMLLQAIVVANPARVSRRAPTLRLLELCLLAIAGLVIATSIGKVLHQIWTLPEQADGRRLLLTGGVIWLTNILFFALTYWQVDGGGPAARAAGIQPYPDLLFPQMNSPRLSNPDWEPRFGDYLYLSFTNAAGFGPGDTVPLARHVKYLMLLQAASSLVTVVVVVSRAVNLLD